MIPQITTYITAIKGTILVATLDILLSPPNTTKATNTANTTPVILGSIPKLLFIASVIEFT